MEFNSDGQSVVRVLDFPDNLRSKWSMYIADESGCLREIIDNSTDESYACKTCNDILINTSFNGKWNIVGDTGRGMPIFMSPDRPGQTQADVAVSVTHAGSKFNGTGETKVGTFGLGSSICNALSSQFVLLSKITSENYDKSIPEVRTLWESAGPRSKRDLFYIVYYERGIKKFEGALKKVDIEKKLFGESGYDPIPEGLSTVTLFIPDEEIFGPKAKTVVPVDNLRNFLIIQEKFYKRKVNLHINGALVNNSDFQPYRYEILKTVVPEDTSMNPKLGVYITFEIDDDFGSKECKGSVNGLVVDSGVHINYIEAAYEKALRDEYKIKHRTIFNGLKMFVMLLADEINYDSQTKVRLKSITKVKQTDFKDITKEFIRIFRNNRDFWDLHVDKLNMLADSVRSLSAVEKANQMMNTSTKSSAVFKMKGELIKGFVDATLANRWDCELYICEGNSAASGLIQGRRDGTQGILGIRGKILNTKDSSVDDALLNKEIFTIFKLLGVGIDINNCTTGATSPEEAYARLQQYARYGRIVICVDGDPDGSHIANLITYLFAKYAKFIINAGMLYRCIAPVWEQNGQFWYPDSPTVPGTIFPIGLDTSKPFSHLKGLGSTRKEQVYDAFFNPCTRRLVQITPEGMDYAMSLNESPEVRKELLYSAGILSNPFNFKDI
jgi:DNA gyrase subunit B